MSDNWPSGPVVVAQRWDGLGGRLNAIVNAAAVAEAHDLPFRFIWPRGADDTLADPTMLFEQRFLDQFEIRPAAIEGRTRLDVGEAADLAPTTLQMVAPPAGTDLYIDVTHPFDIVDPGDSRGASPSRFRRCFSGLGWTDEVRQLIDTVAERCSGADLGAVHVRAGDIVTGDWRHMMQHDKYAPTPFVVYTLERLCADGASVVILSDNDAYITWLRSRFPSALTVADILPGYRDLPDVHQMLADVLVMSHCQPLVGGPRSAFSLLASHIGDRKLVRHDSLLVPGQEEQVLREGIDDLRGRVDHTPFLRGLLARDICWYIDVFGDTLPVDVQTAYAREAVTLDPDFSGAWALLARAASLAGRTREAGAAASRAVATAESVTVHADPMMEALSARITSQCLGTLTRLHRRAGTASHRDLGGRRRRLIEGSLPGLRRDVERCQKLAPYQVPLHDIVEGLRQLMTAMEWLADADDSLLRKFGLLALDGRHDHVDMARFRPSGLEQHHGETSFDPVVRHVERVVLCLSHVLGSALADGAQPGASGTPGRVDHMGRSASGIWWMEGWALTSRVPRPGLVTGIAPDARRPVAQASPTFVRRDDVTAAFATDPDTVHGFRIPVPSDLATTAPDMVTVYVVSPSGDCSPIP